MKSKKTLDEIGWACSSSMRWECGEEVVAYLDWDERAYYLYFEPAYGYEDWCKEVLEKDGDDSMMLALEELRDTLTKIGVQEFYDLDSVNEFCKRYCGSDDPYDRAEFYEDELLGVCGAN